MIIHIHKRRHGVFFQAVVLGVIVSFIGTLAVPVSA